MGEQVVVTRNGSVDQLNAVISNISRVMLDPAFDVGKLEAALSAQERLLGMQKEWERDQARRAYEAAMSRVQKRITTVVRNTKSSFGYYANLDALDTMLRPIYTEEGFNVRFRPRSDDKSVTLTCVISHETGHTEDDYSLTSPLDMKNARLTAVQALGSAITYLRRYIYQTAFNVPIADFDDDGEGTRTAKPQRDPPPPTDWWGRFRANLDAATTREAKLAELERALGKRTLGEMRMFADSDHWRDISALYGDDIPALRAWVTERIQALSPKDVPPDVPVDPDPVDFPGDKPPAEPSWWCLMNDGADGGELAEQFDTALGFAKGLEKLWHKSKDRPALMANNSNQLQDVIRDPAAAKIIGTIK